MFRDSRVGKVFYLQKVAFDAEQLPGADRVRKEAWMETLASSVARVEAAENTAKVPVLQAARDVFDELCAKGFGGENISAAIKAYRG